MSEHGGRRGRPPYPDILTPAEQSVLAQLRQGLTNAEIAVRLGISPDGVKFHISNMLAKLDLPDRYALGAWEPPSQRPWRWRPGKHLLGGALGVLAIGATAVGVALVVAGGGSATPSESVLALRPTLQIHSYDMTRTVYVAPSTLSNATPGARSPGFTDNEHVYWEAPDKTDIEISHINGPATIQLLIGPRIYNRVAGSKRVLQSSRPVSDDQMNLLAQHPTLRQVLALIAPGSPVRVIGEADVAGRSAYVVDAGAEPCPAGSTGLPAMRFWFDKQTFVLLKTELYSNKDGSTLESIEVNSIRYNIPLDQSLFALPAHATVTVAVTSSGCGTPTPTGTPSPTVTVTGSGVQVVEESCGSSRAQVNSDNASACSSTTADTPRSSP